MLTDEQQDRAEQVFDSTYQPSLSPPAMNQGSSRYIMMRTDFSGIQFLDDDAKDGPRNFSLIAIQAPDASSSPRIFH
jgi:IMP dehydrogenase/GMP reductase